MLHLHRYQVTVPHLLNKVDQRRPLKTSISKKDSLARSQRVVRSVSFHDSNYPRMNSIMAEADKDEDVSSEFSEEGDIIF